MTVKLVEILIIWVYSPIITNHLMAVFLPNEMILQQVWRFRLWRCHGRPRTTDGVPVEIIDPGTLNNGPGPDFFNAKVKIGGQLWAGSVEIHVRASDWHRHGHDGDAAYSNVILHVVAVDDTAIERRDGSVIPQLVMSVDSFFVGAFNRLLTSDRLVLPSCGDRLRDIAPIVLTDWTAALGMERLQSKADHVREILDRNAGDWLQTAYIVLARGLGFGHNADAMEQLARSLPIKTLIRHSDDLNTIQALLFGQAGMLEKREDDFTSLLADEYAFYKVKYGLRQPEILWKHSSRSGVNSPERRIGQMAAIVARDSFNIARTLSETTDVSHARDLFAVPLSDYWVTHTRFGRPSSRRLAQTALGQATTDLLVINVIAPMVYLKGEMTGDWRLTDGAVNILETTRAEDNSIVKGFADFGVKARDAYMSQALIQLHKSYCTPRRCLDCRLGHRMLARHASLD